MLLGLWRGAGQRCPGSTRGMLGHDPTSNSQLLGRGLQHQSWLGKLGRSGFLGDRRLYSVGLVSLLPCSFSISRLDIGITQVPLATAQEGQWDTVSHTGTARRGTGPCHGDMPLTGHSWSPHGCRNSPATHLHCGPITYQLLEIRWGLP